MPSLLGSLSRRVSRPINFSGSLDYIDRLPTSRPISITHGILGRGRDAFVISNAVLTPAVRLSPYNALHRPYSMNSVNGRPNISDFRLVGDGRSYHPQGVFRPPLVLQRGAARWVAPTEREWERQDEIIRKGTDKLRRQLTPGYSVFGSSNLQTLKFSWPKRVVICLKRQIRREVLSALGVPGSSVRPPLMRPMSQIRC